MRQLGQRQELTLAQLADRAGISEDRARRLYAAKPSGLPRPDHMDDAGGPLWSASAVDEWCAETSGDAGPDSARWLLTAVPAKAPAVELRRGVLGAGDRAGGRRAFYAVVWDTEHGHVIYLQPLDPSMSMAHRDRLATQGAGLVEPRWWSSAVVVMPLEESLPSAQGSAIQPCADVYRLSGAPGRPAAMWVAPAELADIGTALGARIPVWLYGTTTVANAEQAARDATVVVADTITDWATARERLAAAVAAEMAAEYPAGFAALASDTAEQVGKVSEAHQRLDDSGPGWYLACRPARPVVPTELRPYLANPTPVTPVTDIALIETELAELRAVEGELDCDDPRGDAYSEAARLLAWQLRKAAKDTGKISDLSRGYVPVADDHLVRYSAPWTGPVVDAWRKNLTRIDEQDLGALLRRRRVRRLLDPHDPAVVREAYHDHEGRYVLVAEIGAEGGLWSLAEWPVSPRVVSTWTDRTVLAADAGGGAVTLLALSPTEHGQIRTDPVPLRPGGGREAFGYGYGGGTPSSTYRALLRCALGERPGLGRILDLARGIDQDGQPTSQLWHAISTTVGSLRLPWPQVQLWARSDARRAAQTVTDNLRFSMGAAGADRDELFGPARVEQLWPGCSWREN